MKHVRFDSGQMRQRVPWPRRSQRVSLDAEVTVRRRGRNIFRVRIYNVSRHGCKIEFVERPRLDEWVWIRFEGLEPLGALVCWVDGFVAGVQFDKPIHTAVFDLLITRLGRRSGPARRNVVPALS